MDVTRALLPLTVLKSRFSNFHLNIFTRLFMPETWFKFWICLSICLNNNLLLMSPLRSIVVLELYSTIVSVIFLVINWCSIKNCYKKTSLHFCIILASTAFQLYLSHALWQKARSTRAKPGIQLVGNLVGLL